MNCRRGDVVLVFYPDSNLRTAKRRPALVVQSDRLGSELPQTVVARITSNLARAGTEEGRSAGLLIDSVIMTDNLATIHLREIERVIGTLPETAEIDSALRTTLAV